MLLTLTTTHRPATDLGYLLHKNPGRVQTFDLAFGKAHVFYPEANEDRCTAALLLDVDPIALVRGRGAVSTDYVNDRPYVASSFLSVAIARVFGSALGGRSTERPALVGQALPLTATVAALPCGNEAAVRGLFEPLGYEVAVRPPDAANADGRYRSVTLSALVALHELLTHLYVLVPVLDNRKHYWVGDDEVDKLIARGQGWLESHPQRDFIVRRYLKHQRGLADAALARLSVDEMVPDAESAGDDRPDAPLNEVRLAAVVRMLEASGAARVLDLGCGEGRLLKALLDVRQFAEVVGVDASVAALKNAERRLAFDRLPERQRRRVTLLHGAMTYRDARLAGYDAAAVVEVIEHLQPDRLPAFERVLFEFARPATVVVTTPNREYNAKFPSIPDGGLRHADHRFEWTRGEFATWSERVAAAHGYRVRFEAVGHVDPRLGPPTQMGIFERCS